MRWLDPPRDRHCAVLFVFVAAVGVLSGCAGPQGTEAEAVRSAAAEHAAEAMVEGGLARPPSAPSTSGPAEALARGVAFLIETQNADGSWGSFESSRPWEIMLGTTASFRGFGDATTALCVMALDQASEGNDKARAALERGVDYLLSAAPVGRATGSVFYDTWAHTYIIQALAPLSHDARFVEGRDAIDAVVRREIDILVQRQAAEGGWGYYDFGHSRPTPAGDQSTSFNTAAILVALHEAQQAGFVVPEDTLHDALQCLERLRLPSGAYVYGNYALMRPGVGFNRVKGSLGRSQSCNIALWLHERDITKEELLEGARNLREHHHFIEIGKGRPYPHEAWYYTAGYYFLFGHYYASLVINELEGADRAEYAAWLARTMWRLQDPDGSWFDFPLYGYAKAYGTAYGVLTLEKCLARGDGLTG